MWIIQEVSCARKADLVCSDGSVIDFGRFLGGVRFATEKRIFKITLHAAMLYGERKRGNVAGWAAATQMGAIRSRKSNSEDGLLQYLNRFSNCQCSDPRDKIFALYGISELPHEKNLAAAFLDRKLRPDYRKDVSELYTEATRVCLRSGTLDILSFPVLKSKKLLNLPTWVPDWSNGDSKSLGSLALTGAHQASGDSLAKPLFPSETSCQLEGIFVDTIESIGTREQSPAFINSLNNTLRARIAWGFQIAHWMGQLLVWEVDYHPSSPTYPHTSEPFSDVSWGIFTSARLSYEKQWFQSGLQTPNRASDDEIRLILKGLYETYRLVVSTSLGGQLRRPGLLWRSFVASVRTGRLIRFGMYEEEIVRERNIFVSKRGYFGMCPANAGVGDTVAILKGSKVPLILRQKVDVRGGEVFTLVGDAYVHGMMKGEVFDEKACEPVVLE
ncbi:MAG: hypothetical protein Q9160_008511 [Pyrenula sp. 1 TL-2023]